MSASPICEVADGAGAYTATTKGKDVTPGNTVHIRLASIADVGAWTLRCFSTDELSDKDDVNNALVIDVNAKTATVPAPLAGRTWLFESVVNGIATTFGIFALTAGGLRVHAAGEQYESDDVYGWVADINSLLRNPSATPVPTGTGVRKIVSGVENAAASLIVNADVDPAAAIALSKLALAGADGNALRRSAGALSYGAIDLTSANAVTGALPTSKGGTGQDLSASSGLVKATAGAISTVAAPTTAVVGVDDTQTLTAKTLTSPTINGGTISSATLSSPTLGGTVTFSATAMQATGNARARAYSDIVNVQTTDATVTTLFSWTILDEATTKVVAEVCGCRSTGAETAAYVRQARIKRDGGTVTVGTVDAPFTSEEVSTWDCTIDNSTSTGRVRVTGVASVTIDWGGIVTRLEVSHA